MMGVQGHLDHIQAGDKHASHSNPVCRPSTQEADHDIWDRIEPVLSYLEGTSSMLDIDKILEAAVDILCGMQEAQDLAVSASLRANVPIQSTK